MKRAPKRMGRPPLAEGEAKGVVLSFRVAAVEREQIELAAKTAGLSVAEWCRRTLVDYARAPMTRA